MTLNEFLSYVDKAFHDSDSRSRILAVVYDAYEKLGKANLVFGAGKTGVDAATYSAYAHNHFLPAAKQWHDHIRGHKKDKARMQSLRGRLGGIHPGLCTEDRKKHLLMSCI